MVVHETIEDFMRDLEEFIVFVGKKHNAEFATVKFPREVLNLYLKNVTSKVSYFILDYPDGRFVGVFASLEEMEKHEEVLQNQIDIVNHKNTDISKILNRIADRDAISMKDYIDSYRVLKEDIVFRMRNLNIQKDRIIEYVIEFLKDKSISQIEVLRQDESKIFKIDKSLDFDGDFIYISTNDMIFKFNIRAVGDIKFEDNHIIFICPSIHSSNPNEVYKFFFN